MDRMDVDAALPPPGLDADDLAEMHTVLLLRERDRRPFYGRSPHLPERHLLVQWLMQLSRHFRLQRHTLSSAIVLLDGFMDTINVPRSGLSLVALASLMVAAKMEETDVVCPPLKELVKISGNQFSCAEMRLIELSLLDNWDWKVCVATPFQFVHYFATAACNNEAEAAMVAEEASQMMEMAQLDYNLAFFLPSTVAVAGVLCARSVVGLCPPMSPGLQQVMHIDFDFPESLDVDIRACCDILLRFAPQPVMMQAPMACAPQGFASSPITAQAAGMHFMISQQPGWVDHTKV